MLNIRRINVRHRGPMESEKHTRFYEALERTINELKQTYGGLNQNVLESRHELLGRLQTKDVILYQPLQNTKSHGLSMTYPYEEPHPVIERVGVVTTSKRQAGGFDFKGQGRVYHADRIFYLDELFGGSKEIIIPHEPLPLESKLTQELQIVSSLLKGEV